MPLLGLGEHNPIGNGYLDLDLLSQILLDTSHLGDKNPPALYTLRVVYGWQFAPRLAVFAGPSWNVLVSDRERAAPSLGFTPALTHEGRDVRVQQWPGGVLGVQL